jgi:hypothetical protein
MRKPEQRVWDSMRRSRPADVLIERVENQLIAGMPDVHYVCRNGAGWIELKAAVVPVRPTTPLLGKGGLSQEQINWHIKYSQFGGVSFVLVRYDVGGIFLVDGRKAPVLNDMPLMEMADHTLANSWGGVFNVLKGLL